MPRLTSEEPGGAALLGGALGDTLGGLVEFDDIDQIRLQFGPGGIAEPPPGQPLLITDDTQMTLFTAEALIRARRAPDSEPAEIAHRAYLRWLHTQGGQVPAEVLDGWLVTVPGLHSLRAPGKTCLSALESTSSPVRERGSRIHLLNNSKGCGAVMRAAPVGLAEPDPVRAFELAADLGALTHSHPSGYLSAGAFAVIINRVAAAATLAESVRMALDVLAAHSGHEETSGALRRSLELAAHERPTPERIASALGGGWVGEEALAIGIWAAAGAHDFKDGIRLSVNHSGDSDSTGSITGNLLGAMWGTPSLPPDWLDRLELREVIATVADDLRRPAGPRSDERYPAR
ncbi:ADP-ribosylglycohydrolase [Mycobacteroides sp. H001]|uniref:ADP-ribosylglycohydrolase family protein n=1 Tax=Mycobacteroides TaxID=670516 RepID=UPI000714F129|nr:MULTISPECIES: ADP-ribosylglycohydrolase family protein [Mycobacteroides]KRQ18043.1 ADP-ribosylglycohydrolase [Mycobacteroides sp. H072]KRQ39547.1 ADP-ribosylglycohydrolase [Mycobacteroides sp. H002]KRQ54218.1 ADP-ribosylglycohydrolase [Mycobacteroides sp. H054]KRQ66341.1 ADP-ribosylglycohydrolase [Mycobacteroides sp. H001]OHU41164.1 ADP-ribosylglycohydrolase [Mycobacteroides chelonae]